MLSAPADPSRVTSPATCDKSSALTRSCAVLLLTNSASPNHIYHRCHQHDSTRGDGFGMVSALCECAWSRPIRPDWCAFERQRRLPHAESMPDADCGALLAAKLRSTGRISAYSNCRETLYLMGNG